MVYFIQANEHVKIGYTSKSAQERLRSLQTGNPIRLTLLGTLEGNLATEAELHEYFASQRRQGEWFELDETIHNFIVEYCDIPGEGEDRAILDPDPDELELANLLLVMSGSHTFNKRAWA